MAQAANHAASAAAATANAAQDRKRVKVYELKNNDWYDRGTGFCAGQYVGPQDAPPDELDARILVVSEEDAQRTLLETRISKDDGYQKQQDTLIVWTENNGVDMALSFQEAEGCQSIWEFVSEVQNRISPSVPDDAMSDELIEVQSVALPEPQLGRLEDVENAIRFINSTPTMRNALPKYVVNENYLLKLAPLVTMAEDLEQVQDLHKLCTIMKHLILLNDTEVIEFAVRDEAIMGVVGALECIKQSYDPDFPSHRANHRQYLSDSSKFKEVVPIQDEHIRNKIHWTYRLLYLKDVVLARILDDPTFGVLNSLIFFNQVDIVNHLHGTPDFLRDLFEIFSGSETDRPEKRKDAVLFIQNCCAVSKNIQAQNRAQLYQTFIQHGLFAVITFALRHHDAAVRVAGTDILVALIDHDAQMVRNHIFAAIKEKKVPLTDTLIELLLVEVDLGVKSQMADALKILLDPTGNQFGPEMMTRQGANAEMMAKQRSLQAQPNAQASQFLDHFYDSSAKRLFAPLKGLAERPSMRDLTVQETSLFTHLTEILAFFIRQHSFKSKYFILSEKLHDRIGQLLYCPQKYMKLAALKWFRTCVGLQDEFHNRQMIASSLFDPILGIVEATMPRDNLLNSACLELFEYIKRESVKQLVCHLVEMYRDRLMAISYVNTFQAIVLKYDQANEPYQPNGVEDSSFTTQEGTPHRQVNGRQAFSGLKEMDNDEEAYFNAEDDLDDDGALPTSVKQPINGASPVRPLVNYPIDDDDDGMDILASSPDPLREKKSSSTNSSDDHHPPTDESDAPQAEPMDEDSTSPTGTMPDEDAGRGRERERRPVALQNSPPESIATKRRREEDDEDELGKMMGGVKRRNSSVSSTKGALEDAAASAPLHQNGGIAHGHGHPQQQSQTQTQTQTLRRKESFKANKEGGGGKFRVRPISLAAVKQAAEAAKDGEEEAGVGGKKEEGQKNEDGEG